MAIGISEPFPLDQLNLAPEEKTFSSAERELNAYLFLPPGAGPNPAMIYNHGSSLERGTLDAVHPAVAAVLLSWGVAAFMPHRHGYGNSPGPAWFEDCPDVEFSHAYNRKLLARLHRECADVVAAFRFLAAADRIDPARIGVMGTSLGGINTLFSIVAEPRLRCGVNFAGAAMNWERNPPLVKAMKEAAQTAERPVLYVQAANDYSVGPTLELPHLACASGRTAEGHIFPPFGLTPHEGHLLAPRGPMIWASKVGAFLDRWL